LLRIRFHLWYEERWPFKAEFNINIGENPMPAAISEADWQNDPNHFVVQNILESLLNQSLLICYHEMHGKPIYLRWFKNLSVQLVL
jgi:hypothetical protein